jgi:hypothetical protein
VAQDRIWGVLVVGVFGWLFGPVCLFLMLVWFPFGFGFFDGWVPLSKVCDGSRYR